MEPFVLLCALVLYGVFAKKSNKNISERLRRQKERIAIRAAEKEMELAMKRLEKTPDERGYEDAINDVIDIFRSNREYKKIQKRCMDLLVEIQNKKAKRTVLH